LKLRPQKRGWAGLDLFQKAVAALRYAWTVLDRSGFLAGRTSSESRACVLRCSVARPPMVGSALLWLVAGQAQAPIKLAYVEGEELPDAFLIACAKAMGLLAYSPGFALLVLGDPPITPRGLALREEGLALDGLEARTGAEALMTKYGEEVRGKGEEGNEAGRLVFFANGELVDRDPIETLEGADVELDYGAAYLGRACRAAVYLFNAMRLL